MRRPTIKDVAAHAGVSVMVASRALNNQPYVSADAAKRVKDAVVALGFRQNAFARGLSTDRSFIVVMVMDLDGSDASGEFQRHAVLRCRELGYHLIVERASSDAASPPLIENVLDRLRPEALILWSRTADHPDVLDLLERRNIPYARIDADPANPAGLVSVDHGRLMGEVAARAAGEIVFFQSDADGWLGRLRRTALKAAAPAVTVVPTPDGAYETGRDSADAIRRTGDARAVVLCETATFAHGFLSAWEDAPDAAPAVICLEDTSSLRLLAPEVTRGVIPLAAMARGALDMLLTQTPPPEPAPASLQAGR